MNKYLLSIFILLAFPTVKVQAFEKSIVYKDQYATIIGLVPESANIDSVRLFLYHENLASELSVNITGVTTFTSKVTNGRYLFEIPVNDKLLYFSLYKNAGAWPESDNRLLNFHLVEKEDYVVISHFGPKLTFSGMGAAKHNVHFLFSDDNGYDFNYDSPVLAEKSQRSNGIAEIHSLMCEDTFSKTKRILRLLEKSKPDLSEKSYWILYCEIIGNCQYPLMRVTLNLSVNYFKIKQSDKDAVRLQFKSAKKRLMTSGFPDSITASSIRYIKYSAELLKLERFLGNDTGDVIKYIIKSTSKGETRDKLLISAFGFSYKRYGKSTQLAIDSMYNPALKDDLVSFYDKHKYGALLPDGFSLSDQNNDKIQLSKYKGKVIFVDFWYVGCTACAHYYKKTVSIAEKSFTGSKDVVFISVSTEKDYKRWIAAVQSNLYTSQNAINLFTGGKQMDHPLIKYFNIVSAPTPILIDRHFKIFSRDEILLGRGDNPDSLINAIKLCIKN